MIGGEVLCFLVYIKRNEYGEHDEYSAWQTVGPFLTDKFPAHRCAWEEALAMSAYLEKNYRSRDGKEARLLIMSANKFEEGYASELANLSELRENALVWKAKEDVKSAAAAAKREAKKLAKKKQTKAERRAKFEEYKKEFEPDE